MRSELRPSSWAHAAVASASEVFPTPPLSPMNPTSMGGGYGSHRRRPIFRQGRESGRHARLWGSLRGSVHDESHPGSDKIDRDDGSSTRSCEGVSSTTLLRVTRDAEVGALSSGADEDVAWFEPEDLARITSVEISGDASMLSRPPRPAPTERAASWSLERLPGWAGAPAHGVGLGDAGAGFPPLRAGDVLLIHAPGRPAMARALVEQWTEALGIPTRPPGWVPSSSPETA